MFKVHLVAHVFPLHRMKSKHCDYTSFRLVPFTSYNAQAQSHVHMLQPGVCLNHRDALHDIMSAFLSQPCGSNGTYRSGRALFQADIHAPGNNRTSAPPSPFSSRMI